MRVIVCGGRESTDHGEVFEWLDAIHGGLGPITEIVQGGATGADLFAREWAGERHVSVETYHAKWEKHGKAAGPIRNQEMADDGADLCMVFPGGRGTADMERRAAATGIKVLTVFDKISSPTPKEPTR